MKTTLRQPKQRGMQPVTRMALTETAKQKGVRARHTAVRRRTADLSALIGTCGTEVIVTECIRYRRLNWALKTLRCVFRRFPSAPELGDTSSGDLRYGDASSGNLSAVSGASGDGLSPQTSFNNEAEGILGCVHYQTRNWIILTAAEGCTPAEDVTTTPRIIRWTERKSNSSSVCYVGQGSDRHGRASNVILILPDTTAKSAICGRTIRTRIFITAINAVSAA